MIEESKERYLLQSTHVKTKSLSLGYAWGCSWLLLNLPAPFLAIRMQTAQSLNQKLQALASYLCLKY